MTLTTQKDLFNAYGMRARAGAMVVPVQWDGDWLETEYRVDPYLSVFFHTHSDLLMGYFGVGREEIPADVPSKPPVQTP